MATKLTTEQMKLAHELHNTGVSWAIVAQYFNLSQGQLNRTRKHYEKQTINN